MDKRDWYDMLAYKSSYKYPYRIQWSLCGNVRVKPENSNEWLYADCCIKAEYALSKGYSLLERRTKCLRENTPIGDKGEMTNVP